MKDFRSQGGPARNTKLKAESCKIIRLAFCTQNQSFWQVESLCNGITDGF